MRWVEKLADTPISIVYRPGAEGVVPDALSRIGANSDTEPVGDTELMTVVVEPSFLERVSTH